MVGERTYGIENSKFVLMISDLYHWKYTFTPFKEAPSRIDNSIDDQLAKKLGTNLVLCGI